jgi:DNA polymerase elongation subunit (family B)
MNEGQKSVTLTVHAYDWQVIPAVEEGPDSWDTVCAWTLDRDSNPVLIKITDFPSFCWIELPSVVRNNTFNWSAVTAKNVFNAICRKAKINAPFSFFFKQCQKAYYFQLCKLTPMILVQFSQGASMRKVVSMLNKPLWTEEYGALELKTWENDIGSIRKFLSTRNVRYSQWFTIQGREPTPDEKSSRLSREYIGDRRTMVPVDEEISKSWLTYPLMLSWDIETYSDNHKALPKKYNLKHVCYMISLLFKRLGKPGITRHAIVLGECNPIPGAIIHNVKTELELIRKFEDLIIEKDPDIVEGYNIIGYDYPYLDARLKRRLETWRSLGRLLDTPSIMSTKVWESRAYGIQSLSILSMPGRISIDLLPIIQRDYKLDKYTLDFVSNKFIGKNKHNIKAQEMFEIYELNLASQKNKDMLLTEYAQILGKAGFIEKVKNLGDITLLEYAKAEMSRVTEYCLQDSVLVLDLTEKLNIWIGLIELSNIVGVTLVQLFTAGQQIRCYSQLYDLAYRRGIVLDKRVSEKAPMGGGSVKPPKRGFHKLIACLDFSSLYPSIMMAKNICYTTLVPKYLDSVVADKDCNIIEFDQEENIKEKIIETPEEEVELKEIKEIKEPEEKTEKKIVHYRYRWVKPHVFEGLIPQLVRELVYKRNVVRKVQMKAVQKEKSGLETQMNILEADKYETYLSEHKELDPQLLSDIQNTITILRQTDALSTEQGIILKSLRKKLIFIKDSNIERIKNTEELSIKISLLVLTLIVLDKRQLALKVSANSTFGFLSVQEGVLPLLEGGRSITAWGRQLIAQVNDFCTTRFPGSEVVYNDTDSCMVDLKIKDPKDAWRQGRELAELINGTRDKNGNVITKGIFEESVLTMELEKLMNMISIGKKYYLYSDVEEDGSTVIDSIKDINKKGVIIARRGNPNWIVDFYSDLVLHIMREGDILGAIHIIVKYAGLLIRKEVGYEDLQIIRGIGANYKQASFYMNVFAQELKRIGKPVEPGTRLEFVIVKSEEKLLGLRMKSVEDYLEHEEAGNPYQLDYIYYLEHIAMMPIDTLFSVSYQNILSQLQGIGYKPNSRKHHVDICEPIRMICRMVEDGVNIDLIIPWFEGILKNKDTPKVEVIVEAKIVKPKLKLVGDSNKVVIC